MNDKMIMERQRQTTYGTKEYFELSLMDMVGSVFCYNNYGNDYEKYLNNMYIQNYYLDKSYCNGKGRLTKKQVETIVKKQVDYLCKNARIIYNIGTDNEGVVYNSLVFDKVVR